ncbi:MAG: ABC transporter ATP-binding protein [Chloroflexota bacterium]
MLIPLLRRFLRPYPSLITGVLVFQLIQTVATLYLPTLNADIINKGVVTGDTAYIWRVGALMLGVTLVQIVCAWVAVYYGSRVATALGRDVRAAIFDRVLSFSSREVGRFGAPSLITRTTNDVQQVQLLVLMVATMFVSAPITGIGGIILALRQDVPLSGVLLVSVPALLAMIAFVVIRMSPLFRVMQERIDSVNQVLREQITGIRVIRAFVQDRSEQARFERTNRSLADVALASGQLMALMFPMVMLVINLSSVGVLWFGAHRVASGGMEIGALIAFLNYLMQILIAVMMATFMFVMAPRAEVCAERIQEVLATESTVVPPQSPRRPSEAAGRLELRNVSFRYPGADQPVVRDVSFVAEPGMTVGIIGGTGSGKSTLLNLVPRLADVSDGAILIDGVDVRELDPTALTDAIGLVPQTNYLFTGTVASNLRYGKADASEDELWAALDTAQARDFVESMPEGLAAPIAQGGTNVSGGQRQRLAIARALVRRPRIYLFDDSFSALDYATDAALRAALARDIAGTTSVIVAQRVSTIRHADLIVVLDEGRVVGLGTHDALMESCETYREIVLSQLTLEEAA